MPYSRYDTQPMVDAYRDLLRTVAAIESLPDRGRLTSHWPVVGGSYERELLVVGQAVFGWIPDWSPSEVRDRDGVERILKATRLPLNDRMDPMSWIAESPNRISPFWRTVELVVRELPRRRNDLWYSQIAWTNLYPIAPNEPRGNPVAQLLDAQTKPAADFLLAAVDALRPRVVLVVAGPYWWPFQDHLALDRLTDKPKPLMRTGRRGASQWVIGWHPAGASRRGWGPAAYSELILRAASG